MRQITKNGLLRLAASCGLFTLARYFTRRRVRIFAYHGVSRDIATSLNFDGFFVHPDVFEKHLRTLRGHYYVMPLSEIVHALIEDRPLPVGASAITFDDGYANNYTEAGPLLAQYDLPATFFVTTGFIDGTYEPWWFALRSAVFSVRCSVFELPDGTEKLLRTLPDRISVVLAWEAHLKNLSVEARHKKLDDLITEHRTPNPDTPEMMTWGQICQLAAQGHEIGAHTVSHISFGHESPGVINNEIVESLKRVRAEVGEMCSVYAYPYGETSHFTPDLTDMLRGQGCIGGVTTLEGMNFAGTNPFELRRLNVTCNHSCNAFRALASGLTPLFRK